MHTPSRSILKSQAVLLHGINLALVALWVYAAVSKLQAFDRFGEQLLRQPFPDWLADALQWGLPLAELAVAGLLSFGRTRAAGLGLSLLLMLLFTGYVGLAVAGVWEDLPCACGGIISRFSWSGHLWFNLFFTVLSGTGVLLWKKKKRFPRGGTASGEAAY